MLVTFSLRRPHHVRVIQNRLGLEPIEVTDDTATFVVVNRDFQIDDRIGPTKVISVQESS